MYHQLRIDYDLITAIYTVTNMKIIHSEQTTYLHKDAQFDIFFCTMKLGVDEKLVALGIIVNLRRQY